MVSTEMINIRPYIKKSVKKSRGQSEYKKNATKYDSKIFTTQKLWFKKYITTKT